MPLLKHLPQIRQNFQLFLWQYGAGDGTVTKLQALVDYGKELAKSPATLRGQLAVMAWAKWFFGATAEKTIQIERGRNGYWVIPPEGTKYHGQAFKLSWAHHKHVAVILVWSGLPGKEKDAPWFGVDVEPTDRICLPDVLHRVLNDDEQRLTRRYSSQEDANLRFWCAKEALYKAGQSDMGIRLGTTIEILPTEYDQGSAVVHQFRRSSLSYNANLMCHILGSFMVVSAFLHLKPIGKSEYKDLPLFGPVKRR